MVYNALLFNLQSVSVKWSLTGGQKTKENFKLLVLKVVVVAYKRWLLTDVQEVPNKLLIVI